MIVRALLPLFLIVSSANPAYAKAAGQNQDVLQIEMQSALENDQLETALAKANALFDLSRTQGNHTVAGKTAFSKAKILTAMDKHLDAAEAFENCSTQYQQANAIAQSLHCQFESANAYLAAYKLGKGFKTLENTEQSLRKIGQDKSGLAALVYLKLAEESLPTKLDTSNRARAKRKDSIQFADKAMVALTATGQEKSLYYMSALLSKAVANEDLENFDEATLAYEKAIKLHTEIPNSPQDLLENAKTRLNITKYYSKKKGDKKTLVVSDSDKKDVLLTIKRKKRVKFPRIGKNQMVDGARAAAKITLKEDGSIASLKVVESYPEKEFGEALAKAVKTWKFIPPEGKSGLDIPEFTYSMTFFVKRL